MASLLMPLVVLLAAMPGDQPLGSQVTLPLSEYESLKKAQERASVTVVDTLRLAGSFQGRDLSILFAGRAAGTMPAEAVLAGAQGIVLYACGGDGIVSRGEEGTFKLTPLAPRFEVRCRLATRGSDRLELSATPAVLWVEAAVADGEFVPGSDDDQGGRSFTVVRRTSVTAEGLPPAAVARYRLTLLPDETRFRYEIQVRNPNRGRQAFDVALASGEHVQSVDAGVPYDVQGTRYRFDLPPGESTLVLLGRLEGARFSPPVEASLQYALLESHPLLRPEVEGEHRRVSPQEVGIATGFRGAQAFLLGGRESLSWRVTRLEALRTTTFAVTRASHVFFLSADGPALGESDFTLDNQGSPDVRLPMAAEPTFASLQGEPVLITKDEKGSLWLPIAQGGQQLVVQHRQGFRRFLGFARAVLSLPQLPVPATTAQVELRYPEDWLPVYEVFLSEARVWTPDGAMILGGVILILWTERALFLLGLAARRRWALAAALALAGLAWSWAAIALCLADLAVTIAWAIPWVRARQWSAGTVVAAGVAGSVFLLILLSVPSLRRARISSPPPSAYEYGQARPVAAPPAERTRDVAKPEKAAGPAYQGLPARFQLPAGSRRTQFAREMLDTERPRTARVLMLSRTAVGWLQLLVVLLAASGLWRVRREVAAGWARRQASLHASAPEREPAS